MPGSSPECLPFEPKDEHSFAAAHAHPAARGINIRRMSGIMRVEADESRSRPEDGHDQGV